MDLEKIKTIKVLLNGLRRPDTENFPAASVSEAIELLIECIEFILDSYQLERLSEKTVYDGSDSLTS